MTVAAKALAGQRAFITGAARGIGAAIAVALAREGVHVALNDVQDGDDLRSTGEICRSAGVQVRTAIADAGSQSDLERAVKETVAEFGGLEIAVSNAAWSDRQPFPAADMSGFEKTIQVTMWGAFYLVRAAARQMIQAGTRGAIVVISSSHSWRPIPGAMAYNMAKAAVDQMARTAATELLPHGIRVNLVYPGWTDTPGERKFFSEEKLQSRASALPLGRLVDAVEIARGVVFLCQPASVAINGAALLIDGGAGLPWQEMHRLQLPPDTTTALGSV